MKKFLSFVFILNTINAYYLGVNSIYVEKMKSLNFKCDKKVDEYYVCMTSDDKGKLTKIQDFLQNMYGIKTYVLDTRNLKHKKFGLDGIGKDSVNNMKEDRGEESSYGKEEVQSMSENNNIHSSNFNEEGPISPDKGIDDNELYEKNRKLLERYQKTLHQTPDSMSYSNSNEITQMPNNPYVMNEVPTDSKEYQNNMNSYSKHSYESKSSYENNYDEYKNHFSKNIHQKESYTNSSSKENMHKKELSYNFDDLNLNEKVNLYDDDVKPKTHKKPSSSGYCIQVITSPRLKDLERIYNRYEQYPLARIEKIGHYYVLRIDEKDSVSSLKRLLSEIQMIKYDAFIRKCDFDLNRIVKINNDTKLDNDTPDDIDLGDVLTDNKSSSTCVCPPDTKEVKTTEDPVKLMYDYLSQNKLKKAKEIAKTLTPTNPVDAYTVLGIVAMKEGDIKKSNYYLKKAKEAKENQDFLLEDNF